MQKDTPVPQGTIETFIFESRRRLRDYQQYGTSFEARRTSFDFFFSSPSMESPKRKRISDIKAGVFMVDQVKSAILKGTAVRFDLSKGEGIK
jgi:hypothetical protein